MVKTGKLAAAASVALVLLVEVVPILSQNDNRAAILATGTYNGSFSTPFGKNLMEGLKPKVVTPGVEVRIKPLSRISLGISFERINFKTATHHIVYPDTSFAYRDASGNLVSVTLPQGEPLAYYDTITAGTANAVVGSIYINLTTRRRIQPFIGGGGGVGLAERTIGYSTYVHPLFAELTGFRFDLRNNSEQSPLGIIKGVGGFNLYPVTHLVISMYGGYQNGGYGGLGIGITF